MQIYDRSVRSYDFHPGVGLVIAGGNNGTIMDRVELSPIGDQLGVAFEELAPLPKQLTASCLVILDKGTVFVAGGLDVGERKSFASVKIPVGITIQRF